MSQQTKWVRNYEDEELTKVTEGKLFSYTVKK